LDRLGSEGENPQRVVVPNDGDDGLFWETFPASSSSNSEKSQDVTQKSISVPEFEPWTFRIWSRSDAHCTVAYRQDLLPDKTVLWNEGDSPKLNKLRITSKARSAV